MFKLECKAQNYAWGKLGASSIVGQIHAHNSKDLDQEAFEKTPFAELWMGDHVNGPSMVRVDKEDENLVKVIDDSGFIEQNHGKMVPISELFKLNPKRFLGEKYLERFEKQDPALGSSLTFLFKVLSVRTALSI